MIRKEKIEELAAQFLEGKGIFPVEIKVQPGNRIFVFIDGDQPVTIDDCQELSRSLESVLNNENEEFELTVSSAGADRPLVLPRQFPKHIGRRVSVKTIEGNVLEGKLVSANDKKIELGIESGAKKKEKTYSVQSLPFSEIVSVKVILTFEKK